MSEAPRSSPPPPPPPAPAGEDVAPGSGPAATRLLLVTGMSGAGKTTALKALQDLGYESIDHLPLALLDKLVPAGAEPGPAEQRLAVGINVRTRDFTVEALMHELRRLDKQPNLDVKVLFLSCDDEELRRRYQENRHRHPLAIDRPLFDGIATERQMIEPLRARADLTIDTTFISPGALKRRLERTFGGAVGTAGLVVLVVSFSYAAGVPRDADLVFDVRFLANPHYQPALRPLTGKDAPVARFIAAEPGFEPFFSSLTTLLEPLLPRYAAEGKTYLTIGVGCTGGRHRSVFVAERLAAWLASSGQHVLIEHRGLDRLVE